MARVALSRSSGAAVRILEVVWLLCPAEGLGGQADHEEAPEEIDCCPFLSQIEPPTQAQ